ncbi:hypothetical protein ACFL4A_03900, partial [bacterium]
AHVYAAYSEAFNYDITTKKLIEGQDRYMVFSISEYIEGNFKKRKDVDIIPNGTNMAECKNAEKILRAYLYRLGEIFGKTLKKSDDQIVGASPLFLDVLSKEQDTSCLQSFVFWSDNEKATSIKLPSNNYCELKGILYKIMYSLLNLGSMPRNKDVWLEFFRGMKSTHSKYLGELKTYIETEAKKGDEEKVKERKGDLWDAVKGIGNDYAWRLVQKFAQESKNNWQDIEQLEKRDIPKDIEEIRIENKVNDIIWKYKQEVELLVNGSRKFENMCTFYNVKDSDKIILYIYYFMKKETFSEDTIMQFLYKFFIENKDISYEEYKESNKLAALENTIRALKKNEDNKFLDGSAAIQRTMLELLSFINTEYRVFSNLQKSYQGIETSSIKKLVKERNSDQTYSISQSFSEHKLFVDYSMNRLDLGTHKLLIEFAKNTELNLRIRQMFMQGKANTDDMLQIILNNIRYKNKQVVSKSKMLIDGEDVMPVMVKAFNQMAIIKNTSIDNIVFIGQEKQYLEFSMARQTLVPNKERKNIVYLSFSDLNKLSNDLKSLVSARTLSARILLVISPEIYAEKAWGKKLKKVINEVVVVPENSDKISLLLMTNKHEQRKVIDSLKDISIDLKNTPVLVFPAFFSEYIFSWVSSILPLMIELGADKFFDFLNGLSAMDKHFLEEKDYAKNIPIMLAGLNVLNQRIGRYDSKAIVTEGKDLIGFSKFLQYEFRRILAKDFDKDGRKLDRNTFPIFIEQSITDKNKLAELLNREKMPADFVGFEEHANLSQTAESLSDKKDYPTTKILFDEFTPYTFGMLMRMYQRTAFCQAVMLELNPFSCEMKSKSESLASQIVGELTSNTRRKDRVQYDSSTRFWIENHCNKDTKPNTKSRNRRYTRYRRCVCKLKFGKRYNKKKKSKSKVELNTKPKFKNSIEIENYRNIISAK